MNKNLHKTFCNLKGLKSICCENLKKISIFAKVMAQSMLESTIKIFTQKQPISLYFPYMVTN